MPGVFSCIAADESCLQPVCCVMHACILSLFKLISLLLLIQAFPEFHQFHQLICRYHQKFNCGLYQTWVSFYCQMNVKLYMRYIYISVRGQFESNLHRTVWRPCEQLGRCHSSRCGATSHMAVNTKWVAQQIGDLGQSPSRSNACWIALSWRQSQLSTRRAPSKSDLLGAD